MTWSFNPSLLIPTDPTKFSPKDAVRVLIGDTLDCDPQLSDEEINYLGKTRSSLYGCAAECCRAIAAKFSRSVDQQAGVNKVMFSQMARAYTLKSIDFENKAMLNGAALPYAGAISFTDKQINDMNLDRVPGEFSIGMTDNRFPIESGRSETEEGDRPSDTMRP